MINWLRGGNALEHAVGASMPGRIRIAFPSFGGVQDDQATREASHSLVSREEIAELLRCELRPAKN